MTNKLYKLMNWPKIEEIIYSESDNPHALLGPHKSGTQTLIQTYFPDAVEVRIHWDNLDEASRIKEDTRMEVADEDGYFAVLVPEKKLPFYRYLVKYEDGTERSVGDAYRFEPQITHEDTEQFKNGIHYTIYEKLGAHPMMLDGEQGTYFAVWGS